MSAGSLYLQGRGFKSLPEDNYDDIQNILVLGTIYIKTSIMNPNNYEKQQHRAWSRKLELIQMMGGKCSRCGYDKNVAALEFHHENPEDKEFQLDARHLSNTTMDRILQEAKKCILVCSNCHKEIHYPTQAKETLGRLDYSNNKSLLEKKHLMTRCPVCGKEFRYVKGKKYCSPECRNSIKGYPTPEEVAAKYNELKSQKKVAEYYGLTRKIIQGILKKQNDK